jgi:hypothetical protein
MKISCSARRTAYLIACLAILVGCHAPPRSAPNTFLTKVFRPQSDSAAQLASSASRSPGSAAQKPNGGGEKVTTQVAAVVSENPATTTVGDGRETVHGSTAGDAAAIRATAVDSHLALAGFQERQREKEAAIESLDDIMTELEADLSAIPQVDVDEPARLRLQPKTPNADSPSVIRQPPTADGLMRPNSPSAMTG